MSIFTIFFVLLVIYFLFRVLDDASYLGRQLLKKFHRTFRKSSKKLKKPQSSARSGRIQHLPKSSSPSPTIQTRKVNSSLPRKSSGRKLQPRKQQRWLSAEEKYEENMALRVQLNREYDEYFYEDWDEYETQWKRQKYESRFDDLNKDYDRELEELKQELEEHMINNPPWLYEVEDFKDRAEELERKYMKDVDDLKDELNDSW